MMRSIRFAAGSLAGAFAMACGGGTDVIAPPPPPPAGLTLTFLPDTADGPTAARLGWPTGLPGLSVTLTPRDSSRSARTFVSSADGKVAVSDLVAGDYILEANRVLTGAERGGLPAGDDADGFAVRTLLRVAASGSQQVTVPASRRRSLVISEWAFNGGVSPTTVYNFGGFLELYNNGDTTVYLDGDIIAEVYARPYDFPIFPCHESEVLTNDPQGVWTRFFQQFPGSGHDYPVLPGRAVTIATDAIDHRPLLEGALDLRTANFEFSGAADADNPAVPNLIDVGLSSHSDGHGLYWPGVSAVVALARPTDLAALPRQRPNQEVYLRLPRESLLDVVLIRSNYTESGYAECPNQVSAVFDRDGVDARGTDEVAEAVFSISRRVLQAGPRLVQHTRSGRTDFVRTPRTPGVVQ